MTSNQIEYAKHLESKRHNVVSEQQGAEDVRSRRMASEAAVSQATTASRRQSEDARHNRETEMINWFHENQLGQYQRVMGSAALQQAAASSTQASAAILQAQAAQSQASTRQYEAETGRIGTTQARLSSIGQMMETNRHNRQMESVERERAAAANTTADAASQRAQTDAEESTSRRFRNYASGTTQIASTMSDIAQSILSGISSRNVTNYNRKVDNGYEVPFF